MVGVYHRAGLETARDIVATVATVSRMPGIDGTRVILAGQSAGGVVVPVQEPAAR